jgi:hypothetical protein
MAVREHEIKVRLNDAEKLELERRAALAGMKPAVYLRERITRGSVPNVEAIRERTGLLNRWNANLNMIARWCNIHKAGASAMEVQAELVHLSRLIQHYFSVSGSSGKDRG